LAFDKGAVGEGYILGGENLGLKQILALVAKAAGRRPPKIRLPIGPLMPVAALAEGWARLVGQRSEPFVTLDGLRMARKKMYFSHAKAAAELGYRPRPVTEAVTDSLDWFRTAGYLS
jgi:dihydroflavonol-4-reductase